MNDPRSRRIPLGTGLTYHALEWDDDDASRDHTVILIHGFLDSAWGWVPTVRAGLSPRFHVVAPDMRGHGDSDRIGGGGYYHFLDYLADLHELIGALGRRRVSLVGHSMGGTIASYYAGTYPDRIHRMALLEGVGPPELGTSAPDRVAAWLSAWKRVRDRPQNSYATVAEAASRLRSRDALLDEDTAVELAGRGTVRGDDGRYRFKHDPLHTTIGPYPFRVDMAQQFWRQVTCPVLLVEGENSAFRLGEDDRERRYGSFRDARREVLAGAGHMMQRHRPAPLAQMVLDFLGRDD